MKLTRAAGISTTFIIIIGIVLVVPLYIQSPTPEKQPRVLLCFSVLDSNNVSEWCFNLSSILEKHSMKAAVFFVGRVAEQHPECVSIFGKKIDIGSQTYSYINLTSIADYTLQLEEVKRGKKAVDDAGNLYSRLFRAPYGSTDENIYSLLTRSDIIADFSYKQQYNVYINGQFIKFEATVYDGSAFTADYFLERSIKDQPLIIFFESSFPTDKIDEFISELKTGNVDFINASELTGCELTRRYS